MFPRDRPAGRKSLKSDHRDVAEQPGPLCFGKGTDLVRQLLPAALQRAQRSGSLKVTSD